MTFIPERFRLRKKQELTREKYGENAEVMIKKMEFKKEEPKMATHSFSDLLGKKITVRQINWNHKKEDA